MLLFFFVKVGTNCQYGNEYEVISRNGDNWSVLPKVFHSTVTGQSQIDIVLESSFSNKVKAVELLFFPSREYSVR